MRTIKQHEIIKKKAEERKKILESVWESDLDSLSVFEVLSETSTKESNNTGTCLFVLTGWKAFNSEKTEEWTVQRGSSSKLRCFFKEWNSAAPTTASFSKKIIRTKDKRKLCLI